MLLFRSTCRNAFSLSRCGRGCLSCAATDEGYAAVDESTIAPQFDFGSLMTRHRQPQDAWVQYARVQDAPAQDVSVQDVSAQVACAEPTGDDACA